MDPFYFELFEIIFLWALCNGSGDGVRRHQYHEKKSSCDWPRSDGRYSLRMIEHRANSVEDNFLILFCWLLFIAINKWESHEPLPHRVCMCECEHIQSWNFFSAYNFIMRIHKIWWFPAIYSYERKRNDFFFSNIIASFDPLLGIISIHGCPSPWWNNSHVTLLCNDVRWRSRHCQISVIIFYYHSSFSFLSKVTIERERYEVKAQPPTHCRGFTPSGYMSGRKITHENLSL